MTGTPLFRLRRICIPDDADRHELLVKASDDHRERKRLAQALVDELNSAANLPRCEVVVADRAQAPNREDQIALMRVWGHQARFPDGGERLESPFGKRRFDDLP